VHLGRPRTPLGAFDLVVTTPQYGLPGRANVLHNVLPLSAAAPQCSERAEIRWLPRLEPLPRPRIGLLVGGNSSSSALDVAAAQTLRERAEAFARRRGGSLLVATSPRTPAAAAEILLADSSVPGLRYRWRPRDPENPYALFLREADELIVTGDSASMLADACRTGRPVRYFALPAPTGTKPVPALVRRLIERRRQRVGERGTPRQQDRWQRWFDALVAAGVLRLPRDLGALHEVLRWSGLAHPLGAPPHLRMPSVPARDLERTVAAVRGLFLRGRAAEP
jgi:mitochondrial fission protein ELM1